MGTSAHFYCTLGRDPLRSCHPTINTISCRHMYLIMYQLSSTSYHKTSFRSLCGSTGVLDISKRTLASPAPMGARASPCQGGQIGAYFHPRRLMMSDYKVELVNDCINEMYVEFKGPEGSPYEGGLWRVRVELPEVIHDVGRCVVPAFKTYA